MRHAILNLAIAVLVGAGLPAKAMYQSHQLWTCRRLRWQASSYKVFVSGIAHTPRQRMSWMEQTKRVLVVEDDLHIADLICLHLRDEQFEVVHSADGTEGMRLLLSLIHI